jgi:hypothetical protein
MNNSIKTGEHPARTVPLGEGAPRASHVGPEFVDCKGLEAGWGIKRSLAYQLLADGEIQSVSLPQTRPKSRQATVQRGQRPRVFPQANGGGKVTTPSRQKRGRSFVSGVIPPPSRKASATAAAWGKECPSYRPLPIRFRRDGFNYRQIAREGSAAIYEQTWLSCAEPSQSYEVIRIRRRDGFRIGGRFVQPAEVYPASELWGVDGFTVTDRNKAWAKFFEISRSQPRGAAMSALHTECHNQLLRGGEKNGKIV